MNDTMNIIKFFVLKVLYLVFLSSHFVFIKPSKLEKALHTDFEDYFGLEFWLFQYLFDRKVRNISLFFSLRDFKHLCCIGNTLLLGKNCYAWWIIHSKNVRSFFLDFIFCGGLINLSGSRQDSDRILYGAIYVLPY